MPVWHDRTRKWRESGELVVIGITQEQHPVRCRLFAQWHGIEWPILWDPFNTTNARVVPRFTLVDEHGVVRSRRPNPATIESEFLKVKFPSPGKSGAKGSHDPVLVDYAKAKGSAKAYWQALSDLTWSPDEKIVPAFAALEKAVKRMPEDAAAQFRLGVALRMRHDSKHREPGDFQAAVDQWGKALSMNPNQYIWRRRIQQYGPRLDKPYPFYDWVDKAVADIRARGEKPVQLTVPLSGAEIARPAKGLDAPAAVEDPDPDGKIQRAKKDWIQVDTTVAFDTKRRLPAARVHLVFAPNAGEDVHWNNEAEPMKLWISSDGLPEGTTLGQRLMELANASTATSGERQRFAFEVHLPEGAGGTHRLTGYALFNACKTAEGQCVYLRRDFQVELSP